MPPITGCLIVVRRGAGLGLVRLSSAVEAPDDAILARRNAGVKPEVVLEVRECRVSGWGKREREEGGGIIYSELQEYCVTVR